MRIISGHAKGTKLHTLEGLETRPTLDRVKESVFNIINADIPDSIVLDLFSGSGSIGLEFASRGARKVYLCDNSKKAYEIIKKNIEKTHLEEKTDLYNVDFRKMINSLRKQKLDYIYLDPPYETDFIVQSIADLIENECIKDSTIIIAETDREEIINQLEKVNVELIDKRKYGRAYIIFLKKIDRKEE